MKSPVVCCGFDATSKKRGTALGAERIFDWIKTVAPIDAQLERIFFSAEGKDCRQFCLELEHYVQCNPSKLYFGGEHLITFPILQALKTRIGDLKLVVLDAHHDAYCYPLATHYSVFYYITQELRIPTLVLGARYELEKASQLVSIVDCSTLTSNPNECLERIADFISEKPFYFSLDLDVIEPREFSAVGAPVLDGISLNNAIILCRWILNQNPIACDVVEYNAILDDESSSQFQKISSLLRMFVDWKIRCGD